MRLRGGFADFGGFGAQLLGFAFDLVEDVGVLFGGEFARGKGRFGFGADAFQSAEVGAVEAFFQRIHCGCRRTRQALDAVSHALELPLRQLVHRHAAVRQLLFQRRPFFRRRDFRRQRFKACARRGGRIQAGIHRLLHRIGVVAHRLFAFGRDAGKDFIEVNADVSKGILRCFCRLFLCFFAFLRGVGGSFGLFVRLGGRGIRNCARRVNGNLCKAQYWLLGCFYGVGSGLWDSFCALGYALLAFFRGAGDAFQAIFHGLGGGCNGPAHRAFKFGNRFRRFIERLFQLVQLAGNTVKSQYVADFCRPGNDTRCHPDKSLADQRNDSGDGGKSRFDRLERDV